ncbi:unnamed protein product [Somion occarium]|uniref:Uncharacterized protein n=1 Tax=Somion occarium TaxID=3059160 RepID=A0ABP1ECQ1_9APHY
MQMNRPRESLLSLFDPLANPTTPERNTSSPDSSSDKENDGPGQVTVFFNRIYTKPPQASVNTPKGRLIDFGDVTACYSDGEGDVSMDCGNESLQENNTITEDTEMKDVFSHHRDSPLFANRQPLADIKLDGFKRRTPTPEGDTAWSEENTPVPSVTAAPRGDPLADVINSINLSAMTISDEEPFSDVPSSPVHAYPEINISPPEVEIAPPTPTDSPEPSPAKFASPMANSNIATPTSTTRRTHLTPATTSSSDPRRISVDLQSSFRLQLGSPEMSFDLLNDKISFLGQSQDSFWTAGDDDTIDFKKEQEKMLALAEEYEKLSEETIPPPNPVRRTPPKSGSPPALPSSSKKSPPREEPLRKPVFSLPVKAPETKMELCKFSSLPSSLPAEVPPTETPSVLQPTPAYVDTSPGVSAGETTVEEIAAKSTDKPAYTTLSAAPAPSIPALRIVKKSFRIHDRNASASSMSSTGTDVSRPSSSASSSRSASRTGMTSPDLVPQVAQEQTKKVTEVVAAARPKPVVRGLQRPPPGAMLPPSNPPTTTLNRLRAGITMIKPTQAEVKPKSMGVTRSASTNSTISRFTGIQRPSASSSVPRSTSGGTTGLASRLPSSSSGTTVSGIRPPTRIAAPSTMRSNLPQPPRFSSTSRIATAATGSTTSSLKSGSSKLPGGTVRKVF